MAHLDHICYSAVKDKDGNIMKYEYCGGEWKLHNLPKNKDGGKLQPMRGLVSSMSMKELAAETIKAESLIKLQENKIAILAEEVNLRKAREAKPAKLDKFYEEQKDLPGTEWVFLTTATCFYIQEGVFNKGEILLSDDNLLFGGYKCELTTTAKLTVKNLLKNGVRVWYSVQSTNKFRIFLRK